MTKLQSKVFHYVKHCIVEYDEAPTYKEITDDCNLIAESQAYTIVKRLCELGYLAKSNKKEYRNLKVVDE